MPEEIRDQEKSSLNYQDVIRIAVLYWKWFLLSVIICVGIAAVYLRYTTPVYQATTKMLIKNDDNNARSRTGSRIAQAANLGFMEASDGFDNEMEIITSRLLAEQAARDLVASHHKRIILTCKTFVPFLRCQETAIEVVRDESVSIFPCPLVRILKNGQLAISLKILPVQPLTPNQRHNDRIVKPGIFHFRLKVSHLVAHPFQYGLQSIGLEDAAIVGMQL